MPVDIHFPDDGSTRSVATEAELLEFVNKARAAGGANVLEALLPSDPGESHSCLIARGLNFSCSVAGGPVTEEYDSGHHIWAMNLPFNIELNVARAVAEALDSPLKAFRYVYPNLDQAIVVDDEYVPHESDDLYIVLPEYIGNAAAAFDAGLAFREFAIDGYEDESC